MDRNWSEEQKYEAYSSPLVYCSTLDLIFDYLRAHWTVSRWGNFPISRYAAIIDEIDDVLLDQGTRPQPDHSDAVRFADVYQNGRR